MTPCLPTRNGMIFVLYISRSFLHIEWRNLKKTEDSKVRFCDECNKNVYRCRTDEDIDKHIELNHCIAVNDAPNMPMGMMSPPKVPKPKDFK